MRQEDGTIRPWFELMTYLGKVNSGNYAPMEAQAYLLKQGIGEDAVKYNKSTNKWELVMETIPFLVFKAYVGIEKMGFTNSDLQYLENIPDKEGEYLLANINNAYGGRSLWSNDDDADDIYAGNVYIPITTSWSTFNSTANQYLPKEQFHDVYRKQAAQYTINQSQADPNRTIINSNFTK